jgi:putative aldouronate transport system permease protein
MKKSVGERIFDISNAFILLALMIATLYPLLYVLFASVSNPGDLAQARGILLAPLGFSLDAFRAVFSNPAITTGYRNTLFYMVAGTLINLVMTSLGAYVLSRKNLLWKTPLMLLIIFTLFFSGGLIPTYLLVGKTLGMTDTVWALLIPNAISTWNLLVLKSAFEAVPESLEEAARIDGANDLTI